MKQNTLQSLRYAAERLGSSLPRTTDMARRGILPAGVVVKLGRQWRVNPERLEQFIDDGGAALPGGWRRQPAS